MYSYSKIIAELTPGGKSSAEFVATGDITAGQTVGLRSDGTVEIIEYTSTTTTEFQIDSGPTSIIIPTGSLVDPVMTYDSTSNKIILAHSRGIIVGTVSGSTITFGTNVSLPCSQTRDMNVSYSASLNVVAIAYTDIDSASSTYSQGVAIIGTVSGNSITLGSSYTFTTDSNIEVRMAFISDKIVVAYRNDTKNNGEAVVGTISGGGITFSSPIEYITNKVYFPQVLHIPGTSKVVIAYRNDALGDKGYAVVGDITGSTITFGSPALFTTGRCYHPCIAFDSNVNKVVVAFRDRLNSFFGTIVAGGVSGRVITFGTPVVFEEASVSVSMTFDSSQNKIILVYSDEGNSNYATIASAEVAADNSITIGNATVFHTTNTGTGGTSWYEATVFDPDQNKIVAVHWDLNDSGIGKAFVLSLSTVTTESTNASTWIGIAGNESTSGGTTSINLSGSVDTNQTGLTTGTVYYLNYDGTLTDTENSGPLTGTYGTVGTALSPTSIQISK